MCPRHFAPNHADLGASYFPPAAINVCDALAEIKLRGLGVVDALDLDKRCVGVGGALAALVGQMLAPVRYEKMISKSFLSWALVSGSFLLLFLLEGLRRRSASTDRPT